MNVFTFWEGQMPEYIRLCMKTWKVDFKLLNYSNLHEYTNFDARQLEGRLTIPQIADCIRVHVLRDNGGIWLDADTIMISDKLPKANMLGDPEQRTQTIGFLQTNAYSKMFNEWAQFQNEIIESENISTHWSVVGNDFTDSYVKEHPEIIIDDIRKRWPETYMIEGSIQRRWKYESFYFAQHYGLKDIEKTDLLMLHNSWTPEWYKKLSSTEILASDNTMSNILKETL